MAANNKVVGLIAGQGDLPRQIIQQCQRQEIPIVAAAFENQTPSDTVQSVPHTWLKLGTVAALLNYFRSQSVTHVVMAGSIRRPSLAELSLDWTGTKLLAKLGFSSVGDDGLLSAIVKYLEEQGFTVLGATELLDDLIMPSACLTLTQPTAEEIRDIRMAQQILLKLGEADVGQALIIQQGLILGVEAIEGTEKLISRTQEYKRSGRSPILVKMAKPQQDLKVDLPTIGLETVSQCVKASFAGIAVQAGKTQFLHRDKSIQLANQNNIFIIGFEE
ncbi:LpxI family protein [Candidatus Odyssella thessalonicensis]|uniref:LpxI family protein n=1 Tax=Candidatus Odyssella thessalonicensis TaxID=84647 RepID=UPI000225ABA4|nr:UDP-2,3-diacylglucosamine diphosphatase LpxI [Candidatus Odyssella thessalonicensis]